MLALISTFLATYLACFGFPEGKGFFIIYYVMESMFAIDTLLLFFTQYQDEEDNKPVRDIKSIALKHIKSDFIFDALATFPFHIVLLSRFDDENIKDRIQLLFLLKMIRFRKMMSLFETKNFQDFIKSLFKTRLQQIIQNKQMNTNQTVDNNMILLQIKIMYIFRVLRLIIIILILSYFLGTLWLLISKLLTKDLNDPDEATFYNVYELKDKSNFT